MNRRTGLRAAFIGACLCFSAGAADAPPAAESPEIQALRLKASQALKAQKAQSAKLDAAFVKKARDEEKGREVKEVAEHSPEKAPEKTPEKTPENPGQPGTAPANPGQGEGPN